MTEADRCRRTYLEEQMQDPAFAARFKEAGEAWDVAVQIARASGTGWPLAKGPRPKAQDLSTADQPPGIAGLRRPFLTYVAPLGQGPSQPELTGKAAALAEDPVPYRFIRKHSKAR
jgi:hypothetical protein